MALEMIAKNGEFNKVKRDIKFLGSKLFGEQEQSSFAAISLDVNPMHVDKEYARRLITGHRVVHGIHILLHALEFFFHTGAYCVVDISCTFKNPLSVGETAEFFEVDHQTDQCLIEVRCGGLLCAAISLGLHEDDGNTKLPASCLSTTPKISETTRYSPSTPLELSPSVYLNKWISVPLSGQGLESCFPLVVQHLKSKHAAGLCALSFFVGMICPGLHSLFGSLKVKIERADEGSNDLHFSVKKYHERFGLVDIAVAGCLSGKIEAFARPKPFQQMTVAEVMAYVDAAEFSGSTALIVGGSRGLGELTGKILASGGCHTIITYAQGFQDAQAICNEINQNSPGSCETMKLDVTKDAFDDPSLGLEYRGIDVIFYFATSRISRKKAGAFDQNLFDEFVEIYVRKLHDMYLFFDRVANKTVKVFVPSSVFVESRPHGMTEYAMAKSAAEVLITDLNKVSQKVSISSSRLPRLGTDQTAALVSDSMASGVDTLLPIIRSLLEKSHELPSK
ncbi:SDR family NAD(P)-dependent oxidoreductase [Chromobacterium phragmitis]|uniref:SDR family NAD(P)-dependent oxidoreductase n=1 Tax=Chromobacterium phragmitis TaxID=2202141 RepID=A0ABV0ITZ0_9NEIS